MSLKYSSREDLHDLAGEKFDIQLDHIVLDIAVDGRYLVTDFNDVVKEQYFGGGQLMYLGRAIWNIKTLADGVVDADLFTLVF